MWACPYVNISRIINLRHYLNMAAKTMPPKSTAKKNGSTAAAASKSSQTNVRSGRKKKQSKDDDDDGSLDSHSSAPSRASSRMSTRSSSRLKRKSNEDDNNDNVAVDSDIPRVIHQRKKRRKELEAVDEDDVEMDHSDDDEDADMVEAKSHDDEKGGNKKDSSRSSSNHNDDSSNQKTAASNNSKEPSPSLPVGTHTLQRLRLPSQHTPAPPPSIQEGNTPAPPGGRRLFFETAKKKENKLLLNLRALSGQKRRNEKDDEHVDEPPDMERTPLQFEAVHSIIGREDAVSYFTTWTVVLSILFLVINVINADYAIVSTWNVRRNAQSPLGSNNGSSTVSTENQQIIEKVVEIPDPTLLNETKNRMRMELQQEFEEDQLNSALEQAERDLARINTIVKGLGNADSYYDILSTNEDSLDLSKVEYDGGDVVTSLHALSTEKQAFLSKWEKALNIAEQNMDQLVKVDDDDDVVEARNQMNSALGVLSKYSPVKSAARILDTSKWVLPGENCIGRDYKPPIKESNDDDSIDVVGGIDITALDNASDAPIRGEEAYSAFGHLMKYAQGTVTALVQNKSLTVQGKKWVQHLIEKERKENSVLNETVFDVALLAPLASPEKDAEKYKSNNNAKAYTVLDAMNDIDRLLEIESADHTGQFDHAALMNGARVLYRGPYATSPSLYQSLPLLNRLLAYSKLRFYGHPPEVSLMPSSIHGRGQCWSFTEDIRGSASTNGEVRGEYATLTISLDSPTFVDELVIEHLPLGDMASAVKEFRVLGFEDGGAFGEVYELGSFHYDIRGESCKGSCCSDVSF